MQKNKNLGLAELLSVQYQWIIFFFFSALHLPPEFYSNLEKKKKIRSSMYILGMQICTSISTEADAITCSLEFWAGWK